jgi:TolB-like protein/tetratricopeptide (TPR) repeat protein
MIGKTVSRYRIDRRLGEGGMGEVYVARDLELERDVALKAIRPVLRDPALKERLWREARAAAQLNHPNICQVYEVREEEGRLFIVMELLPGETLAQRIRKGSLQPDEVVRVGLEVLNGLSALHQRGFIHRDVKPSNVFLLEDGRVKLLDFGLVASIRGGAAPATALTMSGMLIGSPQYMAPEQIRGVELDGRADLFALGAVLHEAATGKALFRAADPVQVMYAVINERPPALSGTPALEALGRVLQRALSKSRDQRPASAEEMAQELRALREDGPHTGKAAERIVRLAVLPFRMLRPDPELDFLSPSLADAIAMSLAGIRSLVVRSPAAATRFVGQAPDLAEIAGALQVDVLLIGTILPAQGRCRVAAQLVEVPGGRVIWSQTSDASGRDAFELQDQLARRIVESLQLPLSAREKRALGSDVPSSPTAYEFFLRANRATLIGSDLTLARDLCLRALDADPGFAPAWVSLGRLYRLLGKFYFETDSEENMRRAREAIDKALELHPDLPGAHHMAAHFEIDHGEAEKAIERLFGVIRRNPNDPQGYNGLVAAFRYVGMLEESLAAYEHVRALDPQMVTSVLHTYDSLGEYEKAVAAPSTSFKYDRARILAAMGRKDDARAVIEELAGTDFPGGLLFFWGETIIAALDHDAERAKRVDRLLNFPDPEGLCILARCRVEAGDHEGGLRMFEKAVYDGYSNVPLFEHDPWLEPIRDDSRFQAALGRARERHEAAVAKYRGKLPAS